MRLPEITYVEPRQVTKGDTVAWTINAVAADYPASAGWVLTYFLALAAEAPIQVAATAAGDDFAISWVVNCPPGIYRWIAQVVLGTEKHVVSTGSLKIAPDPSVAFDRRTQAEISLAAVEAALLGRVGDPLLEYEINGIKAKKIPPSDLIKLRDQFRTEVRVQRGGSLIRHLPVPGRGRW